MFVNKESLETLREAQNSIAKSLERLNDEVDPVPLEIAHNSQNLVEKPRKSRKINLNNAPTDFIVVWSSIVDIFEEEFGEQISSSDYTGKISRYPDRWKLSARFKHPKRNHVAEVKYYADGRVEVSLAEKERYKHYSDKEKIRHMVERYCDDLGSEELLRKAHQLVLDYREQSDRENTSTRNDIAAAIYIAAEHWYDDEEDKLSQNEISETINGKRMNITKKYKDMLSEIDYLSEDMREDIRDRHHYTGE